MTIVDLARKHVDLALHFVFPKNCFEELLVKFNLTHAECAPLVVSRLVGLAITVLSSILFLPQIIKIQRARSGKGISLLSQYLALLGAAGSAAYSYSNRFVFSQWGDSLFVAIQIAIIILQLLYFSGRGIQATIFVALLAATTGAVLRDQVPTDALTLWQGATIPIIIASKGLQVVENWRAASTGELALISCILQLGGTVARTFTSWQETGDQLVILSYVSAAVLNFIIFSQFLVYWNNSGSPSKKKKKTN